MTVLRRSAAPLLPRRPMARPVAPARPTDATDQATVAVLPGTQRHGAQAMAMAGRAIVTLAAGTPLARPIARLDAWRVRRPLVFWAVAATLAVGTAIAALAGGAGFGLTGQTGGTNRSALDAFTTATTPTAVAPSSLLDGSIDPIDLVVKGGLVIVLLFVTLRVLRKVQGGSVPADARIRVIESRTLGAKTQLHLVAIGDRQVLIGATPGRLVTLAELAADESFAGTLGIAQAELDR